MLTKLNNMIVGFNESLKKNHKDNLALHEGLNSGKLSVNETADILKKNSEDLMSVNVKILEDLIKSSDPASEDEELLLESLTDHLAIANDNIKSTKELLCCFSRFQELGDSNLNA